LGKTVASTELFTPEVFTEAVLKQLDDNIIKPKFKLPDLSDPSEILDGLDIQEEGNEQE